MKKSSKLWSKVMIDGMFMNSNSSTESSLDEDKSRLPTNDLIFLNDNHEEQIINKQQYIRKCSSSRNSLINSNQESTSIEHWRTHLPLEKIGWLNVKHWLTISSHEKIEMISKTHWKRFWIWLKDSNLQLFNNYLDINPKFTINTIDSLCYPLPEYQQNVFTLTTHTGDTYCFQSLNQSELYHWIRCIHSNCLSKINIHSLQSNIKQLENDIIYENKILKLTELQLQLTTNEKTRLILSKQIELLEMNLEIFHLDIFRQRCYLSALNENEILPNANDLLILMSVRTKLILSKLQTFTPGAFYACVISRQEFHHEKSKSKQISDLFETNQTVLFDSKPPKKIIVSINKTTTVGDLLKNVTDTLDFDMNDYFLYFNSTTLNGFIPNLNAKLHTLTYSTVEIYRKIVYQIILYNQLNLSGIEINRQYPSMIFVSYVNKGSEGERLGVIKGDEIILINNFIIKDLDSTKFNRYLNQIPIVLTLRSSRLNQTIHNTMIKTSKEIDRLSQTNLKQIQKIIFELIQTEKSYVQDLQCLLKQYVEPLRHNSTVLPSDAIEALSNSVKSIYQLQNVFLENLQSNLLTENILQSIAETFIKFSTDFKLYSTYCAMHLRINRLLNHHQNNEHLKEFLLTCNPYHQHSLSFESYLIKPVQRILKYPLFLQQMLVSSNNNNDGSLRKAIKMMNKISKYINSMQKLYENFGQSFEYFIKNYREQYNKMLELHLPELCAYGEIDWINIYRFLLKKNYQSLKTFCFVFRHGCLLLVREELNKKNQDAISNKTMSDCLIRFLPMKELRVELIDNQNHTWQIIQTNSKTQSKTYFRFANKDGRTFVKTINHCISLKISSNQKYSAATSRSCHDLVPNDFYSDNHRRSPSPIWKRRTTSLRKRPLSMPNNKKL